MGETATLHPVFETSSLKLGYRRGRPGYVCFPRLQNTRFISGYRYCASSGGRVPELGRPLRIEQDLSDCPGSNGPLATTSFVRRSKVMVGVVVAPQETLSVTS